MFIQMNVQLKDEVIKNQIDNVSNIKQIADYMHIQILKDFQDEIDKESFGLVGLKEKERERDNRGIGSPVSGNAVRSSSYASTRQNISSVLPSLITDLHEASDQGASGLNFPGIKSPDK